MTTIHIDATNTVNKTVRIEKLLGIVVLLLHSSVLPAFTQDQTSPIVLKPEKSGVSPRLSDIKPQSEPTLTSRVTVSEISFPQLRYRLIERFGPLWFCDPDVYPVGNPGLERASAIQLFPSIRGDAPSFREIAKFLHHDIAADFSEDEKLLVYREYKKLQGAIGLERERDRLRFGLRIRGNPSQPTRANGFSITGLIDSQGEITIRDKAPVFLGCPKCLAKGTRIDTPAGEVPVEDLKPGMMVWTRDLSNRKVAAPIQVVTSVRVPIGHLVMHISLNDGRQLRVSTGHPIADGRQVSVLKRGAHYDGGTVASAELENYEYSDTFDLLPAGDTGLYWANGILLGSTLR